MDTAASLVGYCALALSLFTLAVCAFARDLRRKFFDGRASLPEWGMLATSLIVVGVFVVLVVQHPASFTR